MVFIDWEEVKMCKCSLFCSEVQRRTEYTPTQRFLRETLIDAACERTKFEAHFVGARRDFLFELDCIYADLFWDHAANALRSSVSQAQFYAMLRDRCCPRSVQFAAFSLAVQNYWATCGVALIRSAELEVTRTGADVLADLITHPLKKHRWRIENFAARMVARFTRSSCWL